MPGLPKTVGSRINRGTARRYKNNRKKKHESEDPQLHRQKQIPRLRPQRARASLGMTIGLWRTRDDNAESDSRGAKRKGFLIRETNTTLAFNKLAAKDAATRMGHPQRRGEGIEEGGSALGRLGAMKDPEGTWWP